MPDQPIPDIADPALPGVVAQPTVAGLPPGYRYGVTRYADVILAHAFPSRFAEILRALDSFHIDFRSEIVAGGGGRAIHTRRFDQSLHDRGWTKRHVRIDKRIDGTPIFRTPTHEIDVFKLGEHGGYPGVAVEMEWNNKDPFYHRDLTNFAGLHADGVIAVGVTSPGARSCSARSRAVPRTGPTRCRSTGRRPRTGANSCRSSISARVASAHCSWWTSRTPVWTGGPDLSPVGGPGRATRGARRGRVRACLQVPGMQRSNLDK